MQALLNGLFPQNANNNYQGQRFALWGFTLLTLMTVTRSLVHIFKTDGGAQSIATIPLDSYTDAGAATVISMFAFWGIAQLILGLIYLVVLLRYRSLIPLMLLSLFTEWSCRLVLAEIKVIETTSQAPGGITALIFPPILLLLLWFSLPRNT